MNVWLCPIRPRGWRIIKSNKLYGVPKQQRRTFNQVRPGDLLVFHVLRPINGIVSICRVASDVFEDHHDVWGRDRYPFRVRLEFIPRLVRDENKPIPISVLLGKSNSQNGIRIEPYLKNVWITKISQEQYRKLEELFAESS